MYDLLFQINSTKEITQTLWIRFTEDQMSVQMYFPGQLWPLCADVRQPPVWTLDNKEILCDSCQ